jgi:circadian clock protein KaiC
LPEQRAMSSERLPTGIEGLDELIEGGLIRGDLHLLAGGPGTGKTIFAANFAHHVAGELNERVLYVTLEESAEYLKRNVRALNISFEPLEKAKAIKFVELEALKGRALEDSVALLLAGLEEIRAKVLVVDSLTALLAACETALELRTFMRSFYKSFKQRGVTSLMTVSLPPGAPVGPEAYIADSVMLLEHWLDGMEFRIRFLILKMRGTNHSRSYHAVTFAPRMAISRF